MVIDIDDLWSSKCDAIMEQVNNLFLKVDRGTAKGQLNVLVGYFNALVETNQLSCDITKRYSDQVKGLYSVVDFRYDILQEYDTEHLREVLQEVNEPSDILYVVKHVADTKRFSNCCIGYYVDGRSIQDLHKLYPHITAEYKKRCCQDIAKYLSCLKSIRAVNNLADLYGVRKATVSALASAGIYTSTQINEATDEKLLAIPGIGETSVLELRRSLTKKFYPSPLDSLA